MGAALKPIAAAFATKHSTSADEETLGLSVSLQALTYTVISNSNRKERIKLLDCVTGYLTPGLTALMGPSGCGKTTLLDVLAGRKTVGKLEGAVRFGGRRATSAFLRRYTGYVEQFDTLVSNMTVAEVLHYTCELKTPPEEGPASKRERVELAIERLGLESCRNVLIGSSSRRGISGGQLKRANIGLALVTRPRVLFLDEPSTGLDSFTANEVMTVVRSLAASGITVCATIHAPTPYCFSLFDRLFVMLRGRCVYFGANDDGVVSALSGTEVPASESHLSRAEWLTDVVVQAERDGRAGEYAQRYAASALAAANAEETATLASAPPSASSSASLRAAELTQVRRATETPALYALYILLRHRGYADYRDPAFLLARIPDKVLTAFIILTLYIGIGHNFETANTANLVAALFMWCSLPGFAAVGYTPSIVLDRALYTRETSDGLYRTVTYVAFKLTEEIVVAAAIAPILAAAVWFAVHFQGSFAVFWAAYLLTTVTGVALAYFVAALSPSLDVANAALPAFVVIMLFFTGNLIRYTDMPGWLRWIMWVDFLHWPWGAVMLNQFEGYEEPAIIVGDFEVLSFYSLGGTIGGPWAYLGIELAFFVVFSVLAWAALAFVRHTKR